MDMPANAVPTGERDVSLNLQLSAQCHAGRELRIAETQAFRPDVPHKQTCIYEWRDLIEHSPCSAHSKASACKTKFVSSANEPVVAGAVHLKAPGNLQIVAVRRLNIKLGAAGELGRTEGLFGAVAGKPVTADPNKIVDQQAADIFLFFLRTSGTSQR
jgi:hypothetical protein